jgi:hypothetical protein
MMSCAALRHTSQHGLCVLRFLNNNNNTSRVANLGLGDCEESWSPRTQHNTTLQKLQQKTWVLLTTFLSICFTHCGTFSLTSFILLTSYIHCVIVYAHFLHCFSLSPDWCQHWTCCVIMWAAVCTRAIFFAFGEKCFATLII